MKRAILVSLVLCSAVGISGCAAPPPSDEPTRLETSGYVQQDLVEARVILEDGREVVCIVYSGTRKGGLSCDWENATQR